MQYFFCCNIEVYNLTLRKREIHFWRLSFDDLCVSTVSDEQCDSSSLKATLIICRSCTNTILRCKRCRHRRKIFGKVIQTNWQSLLPLPVLKCLLTVGPDSATNEWINQLRQTASSHFSQDKRASLQDGDMLYKWHLKRSSARGDDAKLGLFGNTCKLHNWLFYWIQCLRSI